MKNLYISRDRYNELFYFCKQYKDRENEINYLRGLDEITQDGMPRGNVISDTIFKKANKIIHLRAKNELIEQAAIEADAYIYQSIIKNVTEGIPYEYMEVPCGRRQFYERRRLFFKILSEKR